MKIGANGIIVFDADTIDIESVESAIFTLKGIGTITKNYPSKDVSFDNGKFFVGLSQEDTITISANKRVRAEAEAQINFKNNQVSKTSITSFVLESTLGTSIIAGNTPSSNVEDLDLKFVDEVIVINGSGVSGADGKSAYELAVENGFTGTVEEWLDSLKGEPGEGSGVPGADGKSAYEIAVLEGFTGTRAEWLESLKGKDGEVELPPNIISSKSDIQLRPTVIFSFDQPTIDIRATTLEANGFRGVFAYRPTSINPSTDVMLELCRRGHDYSVYGGEGSLLPWTSTKDEWKAYIKPCLDRMAEVGVKYPTMYSCSQQTSTPELTEACKELGFKYVRANIINNVSPTQYVNWQNNSPSYECLYAWGISGRTFEYMKDKIDTVIENNYRLIIFAHTPATDNYSEELFVQIVEYIKSKVDLGVLDVLTPKEYYDKYQREADYQNMLTSYLNTDPTDIDFSDIEGV